MPYLTASRFKMNGVIGTSAHIAENLRNAYAPAGPTRIDSHGPAPQTAFLSANPQTGGETYGSLSSESGDRRGGGLLNGTSGALLP